jgi:hypothetical protein
MIENGKKFKTTKSTYFCMTGLDKESLTRLGKKKNTIKVASVEGRRESPTLKSVKYSYRE